MKIKNAFNNGKAFIPFITCGDPDLETTKALVYKLEAAGANIIELGIPFSDPTAEGNVIQGANIRALNNGITTDNIFAMVASLNVTVPLVFMTYANIIFTYGTEKFAKRCNEVGISGIILPDIPFEEKGEFADVFEKQGIDFISLIAPTSQERIKMIAEQAKGFVYCVSSLGVTGVRQSITADIDAMVSLVREVSDIPVAIGFGIQTSEQAKKMAQKADGVIVGSAIVKLIAQHGKDSVQYVYSYAKNMVDAIK